MQHVWTVEKLGPIFWQHSILCYLRSLNLEHWHLNRTSFSLAIDNHAISTRLRLCKHRQTEHESWTCVADGASFRHPGNQGQKSQQGGTEGTPWLVVSKKIHEKHMLYGSLQKLIVWSFLSPCSSPSAFLLFPHKLWPKSPLQTDSTNSSPLRDEQCSASGHDAGRDCVRCPAFPQDGIHSVPNAPWGLWPLSDLSSCLASSGLCPGRYCLLRCLCFHQSPGGRQDPSSASGWTACAGFLSETLPWRAAGPLGGGPHRRAPRLAEGALSRADLPGCDEWREAGILLLLWSFGHHLLPWRESAVRGCGWSAGCLCCLSCLPGKFTLLYQIVFNWEPSSQESGDWVMGIAGVDFFTSSQWMTWQQSREF